MCILCSFQVLLLVDASFGFEMETFEFLNILQAHGFPKVMGVLTHLDTFKNQKALKKIKKALKQRFWTEVQQVGCACNNIVCYCIVLYCIVLYCIVLYCIVLYCIVLYCIVLLFVYMQYFCCTHAHKSSSSSHTPSNFSPGCQGVLSVRAHSRPVPQGGSPQPQQVHLRDEV